MSGLVAAQQDAVRIEALRRQVGILEDVRERIIAESEADRMAWATALMLLTDRILHELAKLEDPKYVPYPHPMDAQWWRTSEDPQSAEIDAYFASLADA